MNEINPVVDTTGKKNMGLLKTILFYQRVELKETWNFKEINDHKRMWNCSSGMLDTKSRFDVIDSNLEFSVTT